jgi:hypothetical protein
MPDKVVLTVSRPFGGSRIANGRSFADLWSDGVVLGTAGSLDQPEIAGELFTFRGTLLRNPFVAGTRKWVLRDVNGLFIDTFATRREALDKVVSTCALDAFRALNLSLKGN